MNIIYLIVKFFTAPGTFLHAFFEHLSCRIYEVLVEDGRYFRTNELCGHVEHEIIKKKGVSFGVCFFPFLFNLIIGLVFMIVGTLNVYYIGEFFSKTGTVKIINFVFLWLGVSFLTNLFPQIEDVITLKELIYKRKSTNIVIKIIAAPIFAILYCGAFLEKYGITLLTSIAFSFAVPSLVNSFLPSLYNFIVS